MGGGGHETMAAFSYEGSIVDMREALLAICREELKKHPINDCDHDDLFADSSEKQKDTAQN